MPSQTEKTTDTHFDKLFWFIVGLSIATFAYLFCITFLHVPKENQRFADGIVGFLTGTVLSGTIFYLFGGSPGGSSRKRTITPKNIKSITKKDTTTVSTTP